MRIRIPQERTYYAASPGEPDRLLCWLPPKELKALVAKGKAPRQLLEDHPAGVEIAVTTEGLREAGVDLGIDPERVCEAYALMQKEGRLPSSGYVKGSSLQRVAKEAARPRRRGGTSRSRGRRPRRLRGPKMSAGEEPLTVFRKFTQRRGP